MISYLLFRGSGTENVVRVYFESQDEDLFKNINKNIFTLIKNLKRGEYV